VLLPAGARDVFMSVRVSADATRSGSLSLGSVGRHFYTAGISGPHVLRASAMASEGLLVAVTLSFQRALAGVRLRTASTAPRLWSPGAYRSIQRGFGPGTVIRRFRPPLRARRGSGAGEVASPGQLGPESFLWRFAARGRTIDQDGGYRTVTG
jgi:hypothetical protein